MNENRLEQAFEPNRDGLDLGRDLLLDPPPAARLPTLGGEPLGPEQALRDLAGAVLSDAAHLDAPGFFAHMDPATPWITWVAAQWAARLNQNLLHPDTGRVARELEHRVVDVLAPVWGMDGGHMVPGSTIGNLTALWAARSLRGITGVIASSAAHVSVAKAADILGLDYRTVPTDPQGRLDRDRLGDLSRSAVVLTAGTTSTGAVDPLIRPDAPWVHVDAAWAGPLRLSGRWRHVLDGIEQADSVAVSAHKWLHQPKESALILFHNTEIAHEALSFGAPYLAAPNIGVLGSHGYAALPLAATILAYGLDGLAGWVDHGMSLAVRLVDGIASNEKLEQWGTGPGTGVVAWRLAGVESRAIRSRLEVDLVSVTNIDGKDWLRSVAANPLADPERIINAVLAVADATDR